MAEMTGYEEEWEVRSHGDALVGQAQTFAGQCLIGDPVIAETFVFQVQIWINEVIGNYTNQLISKESAIILFHQQVQSLSDLAIEDSYYRHSIGSVPGFPEGGRNAWRKANDQIFIDAVEHYNKKYHLTPSSPDYWTPERLKAEAMIESGGDKEEFLSDPLQINKEGDFVPRKHSLLGLSFGQKMTPIVSANAALEWLRYKGWIHDRSGKGVKYKGDYGALCDYNGNNRKYPRDPTEEHKYWYARTILELEEKMNKKEENNEVINFYDANSCYVICSRGI